MIFKYFFERFWKQKGYPKGGILGAKTEQKSIKKRGAHLRAKKSPLGVVLVRFWVDFQGVLGSKMLIFHWFLKGFVNIHVFDKDECPRAIRDQKWNKMVPKWLPKLIKTRSKNMMDFQIDFEAVLEPPPLGAPPTSSRAGAVEGVGRGINPSQKRVKRRISGFVCCLATGVYTP